VHRVIECAVVTTLFREHTRVKQCVIHTRINYSALVIRRAIHRHSSQLFIPRSPQRLPYCREIPRRNLCLQIRTGLLDTDERCAYTSFNNLTSVVLNLA